MRSNDLDSCRPSGSRYLAYHLDELRAAEPDLPVDDRAADNWMSLAAIADLAGGTWPGRAHEAAKVLTAEVDKTAGDESLALRLLADLRDLKWPEDGKLPTAAILHRLHQVEESP